MQKPLTDRPVGAEFALKFAAHLFRMRTPAMATTRQLADRTGCSKAQAHKLLAKVERYFPDRVKIVRTRGGGRDNVVVVTRSRFDG